MIPWNFGGGGLAGATGLLLPNHISNNHKIYGTLWYFELNY